MPLNTHQPLPAGVFYRLHEMIIVQGDYTEVVTEFLMVWL